MERKILVVGVLAKLIEKHRRIPNSKMEISEDGGKATLVVAGLPDTYTFIEDLGVVNGRNPSLVILDEIQRTLPSRVTKHSPFGKKERFHKRIPNGRKD